MSMRRAARTDSNQNEIVDALRAAGASVQILSNVGGGVPDLLIGRAGVNYLIEVKDGSKPPSRQRLTPDETHWHAAWAGQVAVVCSIDEALKAIGAR